MEFLHRPFYNSICTQWWRTITHSGNRIWWRSTACQDMQGVYQQKITNVRYIYIYIKRYLFEKLGMYTREKLRAYKSLDVYEYVVCGHMINNYHDKFNQPENSPCLHCISFCSFYFNEQKQNTVLWLIHFFY